jgi:hypothetical protein
MMAKHVENEVERHQREFGQGQGRNATICEQRQTKRRNCCIDAQGEFDAIGAIQTENDCENRHRTQVRRAGDRKSAAAGENERD